jgi:2-polyprenyl-6-methoxyphenol hydroxylase-like FAD-dependent oxidoreductase
MILPTRRIRIKIFNPFPSHQVDRGHLENDMVQFCEEQGIEILLGAKVNDIELSKNGHCIQFEIEGTAQQTIARWMVDASGEAAC